MRRAFVPAVLASALAAPVAQAVVIYDFTGDCGAGCTATAEIQLDDTYLPGSAYTASQLVSFSYASPGGTFDAPTDGAFDGGSAGTLPGNGVTTIDVNIDIVGAGNIFTISNSGWLAVFGSILDSGDEFSLTLREQVPLPASLPFILVGLGMLYGLSRRRP
ncbi:MAG: VPLPA-CTERM sorting domain-containing protein [Pseudomonadota bacterium]